MGESDVVDALGIARELETRGELDGAMRAYQEFLRSRPDDAPACLRLGSVAQRLGRYRVAVRAAREAARLVHQQRLAILVAHVSMRLLGLNELDAAGDLVESSDWSAAPILQQSPVLSQHLWLAGRYDAALRFIEHAERYVGASHLLAYSKGIALGHLGRVEEAAVAFERALALVPAYAPAHWSLAYQVPARSPGSRVARLRAALSLHPSASQGRADLLYALYRELEGAGSHGDAWEALEEGAAVKRSLVTFDASAGRSESLKMMQRFDTTLAAPCTDVSSGAYIFVVGMPRTGTTLLERMLGNHADVAMAGELNDLHAAACWAADRFLPEPGKPGLAEALPHGAELSIGDRYRSTTAAQRGAKRVLLDKNPMNFALAGLAARALPEARLICLVREPMDACFSNFKELFAGDAYAYSYALADVADHYADFDRMRRHWQRSLPGRFMAVRYEELVGDPAGMTARVLDFCGLVPQEGCDRIERNLAPAPTASSSQVRQPVHGRFVGNWHRYERQLAPLRQRLTASGLLETV